MSETSKPIRCICSSYCKPSVCVIVLISLGLIMAGRKILRKPDQK